MRTSFGTLPGRDSEAATPRTGGRHAGFAALVIAITAALAPSSALADGDIVATPSTVKDSASFAVRWTPKVAPDKDLFTYLLEVTNHDTKGCSNTSGQPVAATWKTGQTLRFTVRPTDGGHTWCPRGVGVFVRVVAVPRTPTLEGQTKLATAYVSVVDDPSTPPNAPGIFHTPGGVRLSVSPAVGIGINSTVAVSWRTNVKLGRNEAYQVVFIAGKAPPSVAPTCVASLPRLVGRGSLRGRPIRVRMNPYVRQGVSGWCPSDFGHVVIQRVMLDAKGQAVPQVQELIRGVGSAWGLAFKR